MKDSAVEAKLEASSRRDRNKDKNRREILAAALEVFAEKGYLQASIQEIADRADFAVSTIYALFKNKEDLYNKVSADVGKRCGDIFDRAMAEGTDDYEKLVNFARAKGETFRESPDGTRMLENEYHDVLERGIKPPPDGIGHIYDLFMLRIRDLFTSGISSGLFAAGDPELLATTLDSATNALLRLSRAEPDKFPYDERVEEIIEIFFGSVLVKGKRPAPQG